MFRSENLAVIAAALLFLLFPSIADASGCENNQVYCTLVKNRPDMDRLTLKRIADLFNKYAHKYGQDPVRSVAIGMQETRLEQINRTKNVIVYSSNGLTYRIQRGVTDVCMFQFHVDTIVDQGMDPILLKNNLDYCVEQHFRLMKIKRNMCADLGNDSWTCYHSRKPKLREEYKRLVARFI